VKVDDLPGLHDAVSGKLVSNKRVQEWEREFLSQQRRFASNGQEASRSARSQAFTPPQKGAGGSSLLQNSYSGHSGAEKGPQSGTVTASDPKAAGQRVVGIYNRMSGQTSAAGGGRSPVVNAGRSDVRPAVSLADVRALLGRFKGHLVIEREGMVSVWLGRKLHRQEKYGVIASIKTMLDHCGLVLDKLIINGIEEEI
jgi:hypothetical protein